MIERDHRTRRAAQDSVGGAIECVATGLPAGIGGPMFDGIESAIARIAFGIPAVKGSSSVPASGSPACAASQNNDPYGVRDGQPCPSRTMPAATLAASARARPLLFRMAIKPTPSIARAAGLGRPRPRAGHHARGGRPPRPLHRATRAVPVARPSWPSPCLTPGSAFPPKRRPTRRIGHPMKDLADIRSRSTASTPRSPTSTCSAWRPPPTWPSTSAPRASPSSTARASARTSRARRPRTRPSSRAMPPSSRPC